MTEMQNAHGAWDILQGCTFAVGACLAYAWAEAYPVITGLTALFALVLAGHGVYRLVWRWSHGLSTLTNRDDK